MRVEEDVASDVQITCIDIGNLGTEQNDHSITGEWTMVGRELVAAFEKIGFAYIRNHGIPTDLIARAHRDGGSFFGLPEETKAKYSKTLTMEQGFVEANRERLHKDGFLQEIRESYDAYKLDGLFPSEIEGMKNTINILMKESKKMSLKLLKCLEIGLGLEAGTLASAHRRIFSEENASLVRILHYPPIEDVVEEGTVRCGEHSDYGTITLLFQDNMGGLEVKTTKGEWVKADPIPGTILVNVGDLLQMWTSGRLVATVHRVLIPKEEVLRRCSRRSMVFFLNPDNHVMVKPLDGTSKYSPITAGEYLLKRYNSTYKY